MRFWDTRSLALFLTGLSKLVWIIGLSISFTAAVGFTGYILFLYLISAICFVGCPCLGIGMGVGVTALWGSLFYFAGVALAITWAVASLVAILALPAAFFDQIERESIFLYAGIHILLIGVLTYFGATKSILESEIFGRFLNISRIEKNTDDDQNGDNKFPKSEVAVKTDPNKKNTISLNSSKPNNSRVRNLKKFPDLVLKFDEMTDIQRTDYATSIVGAPLEGEGKLTGAQECDFLNQSKRWSKQGCYELTLDNGIPRAVLYFSKTEKNKIASFNKGTTITFKNCQVITLKKWGFWSTIYCDM
jgi:hypothetical protein